MRVLVYSDLPGIGPDWDIPRRVDAILMSIVDRTQTDARDLVAAVYLVAGRVGWGGCLVSERPVGRERLVRGAGRWRFVSRFPPPRNLPARFLLIRLAFGREDVGTGPRVVQDRYGWRFECEDFEAHLAWLFAHELHHFRRHHLGLHAGEGEQSSNAWALALVRRMGYGVNGERIARRRRRRAAACAPGTNPDLRRQIESLAAALGRDDLLALRQWLDERLAALGRHPVPEEAPDHCERLRRLPDGAAVLVVHDSRGLYTGQRAVKVRTPRRGATRLIIRTADGREWRFPMAWLRPVEDKV